MTSNLNIAGVWDIECAGWDRFLCGEFLTRDGEAFQSWNEDEFFDALLAQKGAWYSHVGGRYDGLWFLDMCCRRDLPWTAKMRGSGVLTAKVGDLEIRDSFALVPMSLRKFAPLGGAAKCEICLPCECGDECGGYCALERPLSVRERALVAEYLHVDCTALLAALDALEWRAAMYDISLRLTVGSSAWNTAKAWYDLPPCGHDLGLYTLLREGYYGGRTEVFVTRAPTGHRYDIHSSYPAALARTNLPTGMGRAYGADRASEHYWSGRPGIYAADVTVHPSTTIPPLPCRQPDRLLYPTGAFSGVWTAQELQYAESCGARIESIRRAYVWATSEPVLAPFAERVWSLRDANANGSEADRVFAAWVKWLANSLTGKLAQRPVHSSLSFVAGYEGCAPVMGRDVPNVVACVHGGTFQVTQRMRVDACAHVQWSAYLTSVARIELHAQLLHASRPYYCDTDSVYSRDVLTRRIGPRLGEWGYEGALNGWRALAPKVYRYTDENGKEHVRGKGLSGLDGAGFDALERGEKWTIERGVDGLRTAIRAKPSVTRKDGLFARRRLSRALHPIPGWIGGRELESDGVNTRPTTLERYSTVYEFARGFANAMRRIRERGRN